MVAKKPEARMARVSCGSRRAYASDRMVAKKPEARMARVSYS
jgi:hypothetical protein